MSQLSKTAGSLWASMTNEVSEDVMISKISFFNALILGQMKQILNDKKRVAENTDKYYELSRDSGILQESANKINTISMRRDRDVSMKNYASHMSSLLTELTKITEIAVVHGLIDFEDNTRFGGYLEEK